MVWDWPSSTVAKTPYCLVEGSRIQGDSALSGLRFTSSEQ